MNSNYKLALDGAIEAGKAILEVYNSDVDVALKEDKSPLTEADLASNRVINSYLTESGIPIISEENKQIDFNERKNWKICWMVDPLDGTKEFIKKNGEFTVNIALCKDGYPIFGVIYVPVSRELYYGDVDSKTAFKTVLSEEHTVVGDLYQESDRIYPIEKENHILKVVGSRSHMNQDTLDYIDSVKDDYADVEIVSKGSSLKFCLVAEGKAHVYPRFAPTMEWDTAAGQAICHAVGLRVTERDSNQDLMYNKANLLNPYFVVHK